MSWERYENRREPYSQGGAKVVATLTCDAKQPILVIGSELRDLGFALDKNYAFLFDRQKLLLALEESPRGFKVQKNPNQRGTHTAYKIAARGFCDHFNLTDRYVATKQIESRGGRWILKLRKVTSFLKGRK